MKLDPPVTTKQVHSQSKPLTVFMVTTRFPYFKKYEK
jgi:hypothetical protein